MVALRWGWGMIWGTFAFSLELLGLRSWIWDAGVSGGMVRMERERVALK